MNDTPGARPRAANGRHPISAVRRALCMPLAGLLLSLGATACALLPEPHKIEVQQGNIIDAAALAELRTGMTRQQVRFLLGNPVIRDLFNLNRWDYIYYVSPAGETPTPKRLTLFFEGDLLTRVLDRYTDHSVDTYLTGDDF